jgi:hypothetical protein
MCMPIDNVITLAARAAPGIRDFRNCLSGQRQRHTHARHAAPRASPIVRPSHAMVVRAAVVRGMAKHATMRAGATRGANRRSGGSKLEEALSPTCHFGAAHERETRRAGGCPGGSRAVRARAGGEGASAARLAFRRGAAPAPSTSVPPAVGGLDCRRLVGVGTGVELWRCRARSGSHRDLRALGGGWRIAAVRASIRCCDHRHAGCTARRLDN